MNLDLHLCPATDSVPRPARACARPPGTMFPLRSCRTKHVPNTRPVPVLLRASWRRPATVFAAALASSPACRFSKTPKRPRRRTTPCRRESTRPFPVAGRPVTKIPGRAKVSAAFLPPQVLGRRPDAADVVVPDEEMLRRHGHGTDLDLKLDSLAPRRRTTAVPTASEVMEGGGVPYDAKLPRSQLYFPAPRPHRRH